MIFNTGMRSVGEDSVVVPGLLRVLTSRSVYLNILEWMILTSLRPPGTPREVVVGLPAYLGWHS